ncbi:Alpha/Beta hydrolase protein [Aspergillus crustosus]
MPISNLTYFSYKSTAVAIRAAAALKTSSKEPNPDEVRRIPSRDADRTIRTHGYYPPSSKTATAAPSPSPVLINFSGSGWVVPMHGTDDAFCRQISREINCEVLDVKYRLAPEDPFPAALNDAEDVVNYVRAHSDKYDLSRLYISGFSAGGNLPLSMPTNIFGPDTFRTALVFYPSIDWSGDLALKVAPRPKPGADTTPHIRDFFGRALAQGVSRADPRISPCFAPLKQFPRRVMVITAEMDSLAPEGEELAGRLEKIGRRITSRRMVDCGHGWDKSALPGSPQYAAREEAYKMAVDIINE